MFFLLVSSQCDDFSYLLIAYSFLFYSIKLKEEREKKEEEKRKEVGIII